MIILDVRVEVVILYLSIVCDVFRLTTQTQCLPQPMIIREVFDNGLSLLTEAMPDVRSVSIGVWLSRGSRHDKVEERGMAHFIEHMLFKGTKTRSAEDIAQAIDSLGGQLDAFTAKECASYHVRVLDEHLSDALAVLSDVVLNPAFQPDEIAREKKVILEEIKMVEDTPDDFVHELFTQHFWEGHSLGLPILGSPDSISSFTATQIQDFFKRSYVASNVIVSAAGNLEHVRLRDLIHAAFGGLETSGELVHGSAPEATPGLQLHNKDLEQSHLCVGVPAYPQAHDDRYVCYVLNTIFGGSMSSRLFQNIREKRGLAYTVYSGLNAYRDAGALTIYAGCATEAVNEVLGLIVEEVREISDVTVLSEELRRAKDHLKGSLMLSLESTSSRMSNLAYQEMCFGRQFSLDETLSGIDRVTVQDVQRVALDLFKDESLSTTILGRTDGLKVSANRLSAKAMMPSE